MDDAKKQAIDSLARCAIEALQGEYDDAYARYQEFTRATRVEQHPDGLRGVMTTALQKAAEAGEVAGKFAKSLRDDPCWIELQYMNQSELNVCNHLPDERRNQILHELSDDIYYISEMCNHFGISLLDLMEINVHKLRARVMKGTIQGQGDNR